MAPQDDLTAERAAKLFRKLDEGLFYMREGGKSHQEQDKFGVDLLLQFAQTARQEALREGRDYALACVHERAVQLDGFAGSSEMAGVIRGKRSEAQRIADKLDRLASEGG